MFRHLQKKIKMNNENLNKMENGMTLIRQCDKTVIKDSDKIFKIINIVWLVCISGFCVYIYHRVENQPCTCLQQLPGEDVKVDGEGIPLSLQNNGNTPQNEQRRQRRHVSKDGQVVSQSIFFLGQLVFDGLIFYLEVSR